MKKIVLTGGPCAGKTTLAILIARVYGIRVSVIPEAASLIFSGGFPHFTSIEALKPTQRAIYGVQISLEEIYENKYSDSTSILDRGTIDGAAYWPGDDFFASMNTSLEKELQRYTSVIYLESAPEDIYEIHSKSNPFRIETWSEAKSIDQKNINLWRQHPHFHFVTGRSSFEEKTNEVLSLIKVESGIT